MGDGLSGDSAIFTIENAPIGLAHVDKWDKFLYVNAKFCNVAGWPRQELLQMGWPDITHPDDVLPDSENVEALLRREMPSYQMDKRYVAQDGRVVWISLNVTAYFVDGVFMHFIVAIEDITSRQERMQRLEAQLEFAIDQLRTLNTRLQEQRAAV